MIWQSWLKQTGTGGRKAWSDDLFSDFLSFNAFCLIFLGLLALGSFVTTLDAFGFKYRRLEDFVSDVECRLRQIASAIILFSIGISLITVSYSLFTLTVSGTILAAKIMLLDVGLFIGFMSAAFVAQRISPFDRWWASLFILLLALSVTYWLTTEGVN
jgi:hypothetical protein